jgi:hypothetical protein
MTRLPKPVFVSRRRHRKGKRYCRRLGISFNVEWGPICNVTRTGDMDRPLPDLRVVHGMTRFVS